MSLKLIKIEPAHSPADAARQKIAELRAARAAAASEVERLQTALVRLREPIDVEASIHDQLNVLASQEAREAAQWAAAGAVGEPPQLKHPERDELHQRLAAAKPAADAARAAAGELNVKIAALNGSLPGFDQRIEAELLPLLEAEADELLEALPDIAEKHREAVARLIALADEAFAISRARFASDEALARVFGAWATKLSDETKSSLHAMPGEQESGAARAYVRGLIAELKGN